MEIKYDCLTAMAFCKQYSPPSPSARAPFVCFADIFPANGEINPHKCGGRAGRPMVAPTISIDRLLDK